MADDYQFDDLDATDTGGETPAETPTEAAPEVKEEKSEPQATGSTGGGGGGGYADELFSKQIKAKFRTFFIDLKESSNGKFIKISEKSHGRKSTIMMDAEDVPGFIEALQEVQGKL